MKTFIAFALLAFIAFTGCNPNVLPAKHDINTTIDIQNRHTAELMSGSGVLGTGVGDSGQTVIVFTSNDDVKIPDSLEGVKTKKINIHEAIVVNPDPEPIQLQKGNGQHIESMPKLRNPMPSCISISNAGECAAGTSTCVVTDGKKKYLLGNSHVLAISGTAAIGSSIVQPARYDDVVRCGASSPVAKLSLAIPISFDYLHVKNTVDCAMAELDPAVGATSQMVYYGLPNYIPGKNPVAANIGDSVKKIGRTTGMTFGKVTATNVTMLVLYKINGKYQYAQFADQILVSTAGFSSAGDSGALVVNSHNDPVGMIMAGSATFSLVNKMKNVLDSLGVSIVSP